MIRFGSVLSRIVALHLVAIVVTSVCVPLALFVRLQSEARRLHDRALNEQAAQIVRHLHTTSDGTVRLSLPPGLVAYYSETYGRAAFAVLDGGGQVLFSSLPEKRSILASRPAPDRTKFFRRQRGADEFYGAAVPVEIEGRALVVQVAEDLAHRDVLIDDIVDRFPTRVAWITAPFLLLLLIIDVLIFRGAMQPIVAASHRAALIGPHNTGLRLPEANLPSEVVPLVRAINQALDRLDAGFRGQREFTADAAHELRTPLAILSMQIDTIDDRELAGTLRSDIDGMARLVNQLLEFAELETSVVGPEESAELGTIAADTVAAVAPLALSRSKTVGLVGADRPVWVHGDRDALGRALLNLVENALAHTAPDTTVEIAVDAAGALHVLDHGPGVPPAERERIFRRFWRRDRRRPGHAGLGLAIVARIAEMHGATITVADRPGGGAIFSLRFPGVIAAQREALPEREPAV